MGLIEYFQYINTIRKPDGSLRSYDEYDALSYYESNVRLKSVPDLNKFYRGLKIKDKEYEKRSRF